MINVPVSSPIITDKDLAAVHKAVDRGWFTEGRQCSLFGRELCDFTRNKYCQLVNSGSSANLVAITSAVEAWPKGKLILTQALAFPTTVAPIYQSGKTPIYVDTDPKTLSPDIGQIAYLVDKHGDDIGGAIFSHVLGFPFDERLVREILGWDRFFVADCCDALGAVVHGNHVGHWADISTYSFFPAHHITTGEGGAVLTNHNFLFKVMRRVSNWGRDCYCQPGQQNVCGKRFEHKYETLPEGYDHKYTFTSLGYNLKMTELQAAMGVTQIKNIYKWCVDRNKNYDALYYELQPIHGYIEFMGSREWAASSPFGFPIIVKVKGYTDDLIRHLEKHGVSTRRIFAGNITRQPGYAKLPYIYLDLENTDYLMENAFWIGVHPGVTDEMINYMGEMFTDWFNERGLL